MTCTETYASGAVTSTTSIPTTLIKKVTTDPKGPEEGRLHVWRGGGFSSNAQDVRSATRHISGGSHFRPKYLAGFRVVCEMKEQNIKSSD